MLPQQNREATEVSLCGVHNISLYFNDRANDYCFTPPSSALLFRVTIVRVSFKKKNQGIVEEQEIQNSKCVVDDD